MFLLHKFYKLFVVFIMISMLVSACSVLDMVVPPVDATPTPIAGDPQAMVTFRLNLPEPLQSGNSVFLVLLDETTGLPFNQQKVAMTLEDAQHLVAIVPLPVGRIIKYRYARQGAYLSQEFLTDGRPVRYRVLNVVGPAKVEDYLTRWVDTTYSGFTGRIVGQLLDQVSKQPAADMLVFAGGMQTTSAFDGTFQLEGLPPGTHNLVVTAPDGSYRPFEQGALVAPDSATPANIELQPVNMMKVVFIVQVPTETPQGAVVRIAGSLSQLGATFSEQRGDISVLAGRMPVMQTLPDGRFTATLDLPVGVQFTYRYTLGDGLWNAEHTASGTFGQRSLIINDNIRKVEDSVLSWKFGDAGPISFGVTVPAATQPGELIAIQLNPGYGWTEPIPMWSVGPNQWTYTLFSPLLGLAELHYRYCRALDCDSADELTQMGALARGRKVSVSLEPQTVIDQIDAWAWYNGAQRLAVVPSIVVNPRAPGFSAGVAFQASGYHPNWDLSIAGAVQDAARINANWIYLAPTWGVVRDLPPTFEAVAGKDLSVGAIRQTIAVAAGQGLAVGLFPHLRYPGEPDEWWSSSLRDFGWWISWFDNYERFILNYARLAQSQQIGPLILGGPDLNPALPGGLLADGSSSGVLADAEIRWTRIISDVRNVYSGQIYWAVVSHDLLQTRPKFLSQMDGVYVLWSEKLALEPTLDVNILAVAAGEQLDSKLLAWQQSYQKPIILALSYPSAHGALTGCIIRQEGTCASPLELSRPMPDLQGVALNLEEQEAAYNAVLQAVNDRPWINGVVSEGFYIPTALEDKSISVRGKPASGVLWFWFAKLLGK